MLIREAGPVASSCSSFASLIISAYALPTTRVPTVLAYKNTCFGKLARPNALCIRFTTGRLGSMLGRVMLKTSKWHP